MHIVAGVCRDMLSAKYDWDMWLWWSMVSDGWESFCDSEWNYSKTLPSSRWETKKLVPEWTFIYLITVDFLWSPINVNNWGQLRYIAVSLSKERQILPTYSKDGIRVQKRYSLLWQVHWLYMVLRILFGWRKGKHVLWHNTEGHRF